LKSCLNPGGFPKHIIPLALRKHPTLWSRLAGMSNIVLDSGELGEIPSRIRGDLPHEEALTPHGFGSRKSEMLTTKEAIEKRRSIRKFKSEPVPDEYITELIEAARLAPSGCNAQPWRFKIVKEPELKARLAHAAFDQAFIARAPVVIVCCADIQGYLDGTVSGVQDLAKAGAVEDRIVKVLTDRASELRSQSAARIGPKIIVNVAIAVEHIVLRALDFGLGTCWVRLLDGNMIRDIFGWDENIFVVALLPLGFPDESPKPRKRMPLQALLLK
jgi:nitroreductase